MIPADLLLRKRPAVVDPLDETANGDVTPAIDAVELVYRVAE